MIFGLLYNKTLACVLLLLIFTLRNRRRLLACHGRFIKEGEAMFRRLSAGTLLLSLTIHPGKVAASQFINSTAAVLKLSAAGYTESIVFNVEVDEKQTCKLHNGRIDFKIVVKSPEGIDQIREGYQTWSNLTEKRFTVQWTGHRFDENETLKDVTDIRTDSLCLDR